MTNSRKSKIRRRSKENNNKNNNNVDDKNHVRVVSRIRPLAKYELDKGCSPVVVKVPTIGSYKNKNNNNNHSHHHGPETLQINQPSKRWYQLDAVLDESCTQNDVYEQSGAYKAISEDLFAGFNCTILAYGQTGAGKTFTMGTAAKTTSTSGGGLEESAGVIPRACQDLFDNIASKCDSNAHVELSYLEVYNEEIRDLLINSNQQNQNHLRIRERLNGEVYVCGLQTRTVSNPADVGRLMEEASGRRVVASTKMNATSSRSHAICVLKIKGVLEDATTFQSKLTLVDLAGSERIKKTEAKGSRAQEGININKGLFVLGQVVSALAEQRPKYKRKPPFRDSKLTRLLQDSLGGNSRTIMIACCSPADFNIEETINTLRYATQARNIQNTATANVVQQISQEEAMKLQRETTLLKAQIVELQETIRKLTDDVTEEEIERSVQLVEAERRASMEMESNLLSMSIPTKLQSLDSISERRSDQTRPSLRVRERRRTRTSSRRSSSGSSSNVIIRNGSLLFAGGSLVEDDDNDDGGTAMTNREFEELEEENAILAARLHQAQGNVKATVSQSALELPALRSRVKVLEEELKEALAFKQETVVLKQELEEANADRLSALTAAQQLAEFLEEQKAEQAAKKALMEKEEREQRDKNAIIKSLQDELEGAKAEAKKNLLVAQLVAQQLADMVEQQKQDKQQELQTLRNEVQQVKDEYAAAALLAARQQLVKGRSEDQKQENDITGLGFEGRIVDLEMEIREIKAGHDAALARKQREVITLLRQENTALRTAMEQSMVDHETSLLATQQLAEFAIKQRSEVHVEKVEALSSQQLYIESLERQLAEAKGIPAAQYPRSLAISSSTFFCGSTK